MTIDERLEALTQAVELLAAIHQDSERANAERWAEMDKRWAETDKRFAETARQLAEVMQAINTLGRIAGLHQELLDDHGDRLDNLEKQ